MQTDESRQGILAVVKFNLAVAKTTLAAARENHVVTVNPRIKWRQEMAELARCSENPFWLQQKYVVLTLLEHETLDIKRGATTILGFHLRKDG